MILPKDIARFCKMIKRYFISIILFLLSGTVAFTAIQPCGFAQVGTDFGQLSNIKEKEEVGTSALGTLSLGVEDQKYYRFLKHEEKQRLTEGLRLEKKLEIFEGLSDEDRLTLLKSLTHNEMINLFKNLSATTKREVFESLTDDEKSNFFRILDDDEKCDLFELLDDEDKISFFNTLDDNRKDSLFELLDDKEKIIILSNLNDLKKVRLINKLPEEERIRWFTEYPELKEIDILAEAPSEKPEAIEEEVPPLSDIEKILSGEFPTDIKRTLRQFGYDFFQKGPSAFIPETVVPVGPDYIIGPDDRFTINLWGKAEETYLGTVSRDGTITLPRLGTVDVGGLTFSELKSFLLQKFKEYYTDFEMSITMDALRTIEVFIIGELDTPGTYSLNALSTGVSALFASGGPNKSGSLRNIKVLDSEDVVKTIDLYEFFIKGAKANDVRLQQGYTVFIPVIGPIIGIAGQVKRPAIYEMKGEQTIGEIIELAGGVLPTGHLQHVVVERIIAHERRIIKSFNLDPSYEKSSLNLETPVQDGDVIKVYPVYKRMEQVVYLEGHVKYPREYEWKQGMRLSDIISSFDCLRPEPYLPQAEIIRLMPPDLHPEIIEFDLGALLEGNKEQNLTLQDQDRIKVYGIWEKSDIPEVTISGALRNPGTYRLYKGMTIRDLIFQAGNVTDRAYMDNAELTRIVQGSAGTDTIKLTFSPQRALEGDIGDNIVLQKDDYVQIREKPKYAQALARRMFLEGEFMFPGTYSFSEGERLSSVIERAGGLTEEAYPSGAVFLRDSVKEIQRERRREYISKLEEDILTLSTYSAETALDASQAALLQQTLSAKKELVQKLKASEPTGRMVIKISDIVLMPSSDYDVALKPGDRLIVGKKPDSVNVMGEVYNPNALLVEKGRDVRYYLSLVGGPTDTADKKQLYIVKADGTVISKKQEKFGLFNWDMLKNRWTWGSFNSIELDPGDTIIVPKKIEKIGWLKYTKDVTGILYEIAVAAGVLHEIFTD
jgi:polysaccharide export outer membrane protein